MIDAVFIWKCGEETIERVESNAEKWEVGISTTPVACLFSTFPPRQGKVAFLRTEQSRWVVEMAQARPIFVSYHGEEPWMAKVLKRSRLRDELAKLEDEMAKERLL